LDGVKAAVEQRVASGELLRQGSEIASRESLQAEDEFVTWAEANRTGLNPLGRAAPAKGLAQEQAAAVAAVLNSRSQVQIFQGDAGTGKTTCLKAVVAGIESAGGRVFGCAPSTGATDVLRRELTAEAETLQQLLANPAMQNATRGRVVIVDEAGLVSVRQMRDLCRLAAANDNRLVLVGDVKQHTSVEAGDALRCLHDCIRLSQQESLDLIKPDPARPFQRPGRLYSRGAGLDAKRPAVVKQEPDTLVRGRLLPVNVYE
jgi:ATP-dependent exoDNAse (exonuclease V) alpha subunit